MYDELIESIATYTADEVIKSEEAFKTARACLLDSLGCAFLALKFKACTKLLGPLVPGTIVPGGTRVPGTPFILDPIRAAFNFGTMIRWLDFNDTWLAAEWGHPSDNLGALLSIADYLCQNGQKIYVKDLLTALIKAHEIQGILALKNSLNCIGLDHVFFVKLASTAVSTKLLGGSKEQIAAAFSNACIDTGPLRTYRHAPNTGSRKSWAAGDATSRALNLAWMTMQGEMGYNSALTAKQWGLYDVLFKGKPWTIPQAFGSYVMENVLFKISFPAEFHAQTAVEAAIHSHDSIKEHLKEIEKIEIDTHESAIRIIDKKGPLKNPADRDHCLQYMVAIGLIYGELTAEHYEEEISRNPLIDQLRDKMLVKENKQFSQDYLDPEKRSIANSLTIHLKDGRVFGPYTVEYPLGHKRRRAEGIPLLYEKFKENAKHLLPKNEIDAVLELFQDESRLDQMTVSELVDLFVKK
jgi:2-methylcitrate dehydratase